MADRLYRSKDDRILGGVCGGLAEYFDLDPTLVRLAVILLEFMTAGSAIVFYLIAWLIIPSETEVTDRETSSKEASGIDLDSEETTEENTENSEDIERNDLDYESPENEKDSGEK